MTTVDTPRESLLSRLDRIADQTSGELSKQLVTRELAGALTKALSTLWIAPCVYLGLVLLSRVFGFTAPIWQAFALLTFVPPLIYVGLRWVAARQLLIDRRAALAEMDRQLELQDRLLAADEFLQRGERSDFMEAAIEDAVQPAEKAVATAYQATADASFPVQRWSMVLLAIGLLGIGAWLSRPAAASPTGDTPPSGPKLDAAGSPVVSAKRKSDRNPRKTKRPPEQDQPNKKKAKPATVAKPRQATAPLTGDTKQAAGESGAGVSADATTASGDSQSRGIPSDQSQATDSSDKNKSPKKKRKKPKKPKPSDSAKKKAKPEKSGSTAGKGSAGGSSRNPTSSTWSSKDKVVTSEEDPFDDDEEVDEEESEQESRGGIQPNLRDRRPPVSRDLTIGFGNQKNPDANGRGGPGAQKKSRGVASLVLGVPIPDHVKGQPNPGKTKIHQERIEPQAEQATPIDAVARSPRATPIGYWPTMPLRPWMRELVRTYFSKAPSASDESNP